MKIRLNYYLVNIGAFFCTLPFFAPIPIGSDVQYPIFLLCTIVIFLDIFSKGEIRLRKIELYFLFVALISFAYINPFYEYDYSIFKRVGLLFGFLIFYVYSRYWHIVKPKYILAGIYVNFITAIAHFMFAESFSRIAGNITRVIKIVDMNGNRGVSGLAPEPGFLGGMCAFFILISYIFLNERKISKNKFIVVVFLSVIMMFMTKSGTAMLFLFVLCGLFFLFSRYAFWKKVLAGTCVMLFLIVIIYHSGFSGRGISIAQNLIENPKLVFVADESVAQRGIAVSVGILSIAQGNILGHGIGTLYYVAENIISETYLGDVYANVRNYSHGLLSSFAQYIVELGLFFIILLIWLYFNVGSRSYVKIVRVTSLLYLIASFSILFPPLWLLLASTDIRNSSCPDSRYRPLKSQI
jgi:hypothetical protein